MKIKCSKYALLDRIKQKKPKISEIKMQQSVPMSQISEINMQQTFHVLQYTGSHSFTNPNYHSFVEYFHLYHVI